jgi:hypothetical protein
MNLTVNSSNSPMFGREQEYPGLEPLEQYVDADEVEAD